MWNIFLKPSNIHHCSHVTNYFFPFFKFLYLIYVSSKVYTSQFFYMWIFLSIFLQYLRFLFCIFVVAVKEAGSLWSFHVTQWVKDLALSLLWRGFDSWPRNFHMPWMCPKKRTKQTGSYRIPPQFEFCGLYLLDEIEKSKIQI